MLNRLLEPFMRMFRKTEVELPAPKWKFITNAEIESGNLSKYSINFFNTFGYLCVPAFFKPELVLLDSKFDHLFRKKFGLLENRSYFYPQFIDESKNLVDILALSKVRNLIVSLLGEKPIYKGSEGALFRTGSGWKRDYLNKAKSIKILTYLQSSNSNSGALRVIPGSHFLNDAFSQFLTHALVWPHAPVGGGLEEKDFLPVGSNPL